MTVPESGETEPTRAAMTAGGEDLWRLLDAMKAATHGGVSQSTVTAWTETLERAMTLRGRAIESALTTTSVAGRAPYLGLTGAEAASRARVTGITTEDRYGVLHDGKAG